MTCTERLSAAAHCKRVGLQSCKEFARLAGVTVNTLNNWHRNDPQQFDTALAQAAVTRRARRG
jgi:DNA-binding transcriptional regulator YiaG